MSRVRAPSPAHLTAVVREGQRRLSLDTGAGYDAFRVPNHKLPSSSHSDSKRRQLPSADARTWKVWWKVNAYPWAKRGVPVALGAARPDR